MSKLSAAQVGTLLMALGGTGNAGALGGLTGAALGMAKNLYGKATGRSRAAAKTTKAAKAVVKRAKKIVKASASKSVAKRVTRLEKSMRENLSEYEYRLMSASVISIAAVNSCVISPVISETISTIETVLGEARFYDEQVPATLVQASLVTGTYARKIHMAKQCVSCTFKNSYDIPVYITVWVHEPKGAHSTSVVQAFQDGCADNASGALTVTDPQVELRDSRLVGQLWTRKKTVKKLLNPGQQLVVNYCTKGFKYDPAFADIITSSYQQRFHTFSMDCKVEGVLGHNATLSVQGLMIGSVDVLAQRSWKVIYDAGIDLKYVVLPTATLGAINSATAVTGMANIPNNMVYSLA